MKSKKVTVSQRQGKNVTSKLEDARRMIRKVLKQTNASGKRVLKGLESSREEVYQKYYPTYKNN